MGEPEDERESDVGKLFEDFVQASSCKGTLQAFNILCGQLDLDPADHGTFYECLKAEVTSWKAKALWSKLDKRMSHKEYRKGDACVATKCLIIGGGPCGLRTAIELALMGAKVVVIEKRDSFSRNNVLHLWPFTIHDLRGLGAKMFYGKFCAGAIDHISIRQLQLMLLKVALIVAVEFHINVEFVKMLEPPEHQENEGPGWRAAIRPADHPVADFEFDVVVGADGRRNTLEGFKRKDFRGKLAIAITANFINRNTTAEAKVEEISGVAFIFNQKFFLDLKEETGIDLENIVYYKDNTHYFVMTAKKQSLLHKGVVMKDYTETQRLLSSDNVNQEALLCYAREAADFGTNYQLPTLDFAINHCGQPDVAMFDFTSMHASENAALVRERFGHQLLVALVGDSLLEPFWPMGTGCARGFLAAFDTAWMVKSWAQGRTVLEVLAERESIYRLLPQTTPENIAKNLELYTIDPATRYPNLISSCVRPHQVRHLYLSGELNPCSLERAASIRRPVNICRRDSEIRPARLLTWCQKQTEGYRNVTVTDLTVSWTSGLALCALIHRFKPHLIDFESLNEENQADNLQLAFDIGEREFGIRPFASVKELSGSLEPEKTKIINYLSKFYELFRGTPLPDAGSRRVDENSEDYPSKEVRSNNNVLNLALPRKRVPKDEKKTDGTDSIYKRRRTFCAYSEEATILSTKGTSMWDGREPKENKVRSMATQLQAKIESTTSYTQRKLFQVSIRRAARNLVPAELRPNARELPPQPPCRFSVVKLRPVLQTHERTEISPESESEVRTAPAVHSAVAFMSRVLRRLKEVDELICEGSSVQRAFPQSGEKCHSCQRRVYLVERICAEGFCFHRECFRCTTCSSALRQGSHAFDSQHGKLYCKLHFDQLNNGKRLHRNVSPRSNHFGRRFEGRCAAVEESASSGCTAALQSQPAAGTFSSLVRKQLSRPLSVARAVCSAPRRVCRRVRGAARAFASHLRDNVQDYAFLYELLSLSLPLLLVLYDVLLQMQTEAVPRGPGSRVLWV
ncbi:F-actin-monooxygenase MICAL2 isoform X1 [Phycodurus eques]|uniref:F-actin-monooxygenase MICAL2 isoform X1 n=1 Tax=Phycodurus eques TaxID=693459 RepID=UPI002ACDDE13|nr:F-actin-monooxygenase MICAL2 isoform X1 [Phycodurus eques]XP_061526676.1 F-actin-monooxygenase MICAL2 isoform X1 [Phycodurus eques]XP_061526677.1 F-actin-monooxygenase MICAL2 isoform X1 [Phycodurus eques]